MSNIYPYLVSSSGGAVPPKEVIGPGDLGSPPLLTLNPLETPLAYFTICSGGGGGGGGGLRGTNHPDSDPSYKYQIQRPSGGGGGAGGNTIVDFPIYVGNFPPNNPDGVSVDFEIQVGEGGNGSGISTFDLGDWDSGNTYNYTGGAGAAGGKTIILYEGEIVIAVNGGTGGGAGGPILPGYNGGVNSGDVFPRKLIAGTSHNELVTKTDDEILAEIGKVRYLRIVPNTAVNYVVGGCGESTAGLERDNNYFAGQGPYPFPAGSSGIQDASWSSAGPDTSAVVDTFTGYRPYWTPGNNSFHGGGSPTNVGSFGLQPIDDDERFWESGGAGGPSLFGRGQMGPAYVGAETPAIAAPTNCTSWGGGGCGGAGVWCNGTVFNAGNGVNSYGGRGGPGICLVRY